MTDRPLLIDLFCGAGGAAMGYHRAGFDVLGVDHEPQPRYPFEFIQGDVFEVWGDLPHDAAAAYHASPPCQAYSATQQLQNNEHPDLVADTRKLLQATGKPYAIENVPGSPLIDPVVLYGTMFGLRVNRPRLFECSFTVPFMLAPPPAPQAKMGRPPRWKGDFIQPVGNFSAVDYARDAMGIDWMTRDELAQAIPPAYTEYIGKYLMEHIKVAV